MFEGVDYMGNPSSYRSYSKEATISWPLPDCHFMTFGGSLVPHIIHVQPLFAFINVFHSLGELLWPVLPPMLF